MKRVYIFLLLSISQFANGQRSDSFISGTIVDSQTGNPIQFASVYVNGTTSGCVSNEKGEFILDVKFPCQVVVSHLGYQTRIFYADSFNARYRILMDTKVFNLNGVTVSSKGSISRRKNISIFKSAFLGTDRWGRNAELLNEDVLIFTSMKQGLSVEASSQLEVDLPLLGYKMMVDLVSFCIDRNEVNNSEQYYGTAFYYFIPVNAKTERQEDNILKNRLRSYYCSDLHFCRAFYSDSISSNGYLITRGRKSAGINSNQPVSIEKEYFKDKNNIEYLRIIGYKDSSYVINFYHRNGYPVNISKEKHKIKLVSGLFFTEDTCIIRSNGTISDNSIMFSGEIGEKRAGSILPEDYEPGLLINKDKSRK